MSERRHRSTSEGRGKRILVWAGWGLVVLLLGGNLVIGLVNKKGNALQGFLTPDHLLRAAFWAPMTAALALSVCGLWWSSKAYAHGERTSLLWARRGYLFTLVATVVSLMATFDRDMFPREWLSVIAAFVIGGQTLFSAMFAFKEYRRAESGEGSRRPRGRLETPLMKDVSVAPPDASGTAK
jgi:hypothetical protein